MQSAPWPPWTCRSTNPGTMKRSGGAGPGSMARIWAVQRMVPATQPTDVRICPARAVDSMCSLSAAAHLGHEVVADAAVDRARELHRAAVGEVAVADLRHNRAAAGDAQALCIVHADRGGAQVLQCS